MPKAKQEDSGKKRKNNPGGMTTSDLKNQHMRRSRQKQLRHNKKQVGGKPMTEN
jgi:hypothetical protein